MVQIQFLVQLHLLVAVQVKDTMQVLIEKPLKLLEDLEEVFKEKEHLLQHIQLEVKEIRLQQVLLKDLMLEMQVVVQNIDMVVVAVLEVDVSVVEVVLVIVAEIVMETEMIVEVDMVTVEEETVMQVAPMEILAGDVAAEVQVEVEVAPLGSDVQTVPEESHDSGRVWIHPQKFPS